MLVGYLDGPADQHVFKLSRNAYALAVREMCWHPHQLRHVLATKAAHESRSIGTAATLVGDSEATAAGHHVHVDPAGLTRAEGAKLHG